MLIRKNRYIDALKKFVVFTAIIHIYLLIVYSIMKSDIMHLSYFNIIGLNLFLPDIMNGVFSQIVSIIIIVTIYFIIYFYFVKKD